MGAVYPTGAPGTHRTAPRTATPTGFRANLTWSSPANPEQEISWGANSGDVLWFPSHSFPGSRLLSNVRRYIDDKAISLCG
jgi:hypothetical protein